MSWVERYVRVFLRTDESGRQIFYPRAPRGYGYLLPADRVAAVRRYLTFAAWVHFGLVFGAGVIGFVTWSPLNGLVAAVVLALVGEAAYWLRGRPLARDCPVAGPPGRNETIELLHAIFPGLVRWALLAFFVAMTWMVSAIMAETGPKPIPILMLLGFAAAALLIARSLRRG